MKPNQLISSGMLLLLLGTVVPAHGQGERQEREDKSQKREQPDKAHMAKKQEARPVRPPPGNPAKGEKDQKGQRPLNARQAQDARQRAQQQERNPPEANQNQRQQQTARQRDQQHERQARRPLQPDPQQRAVAERRGIWQGRRAQNWRSEHRNWQQRGGYNGYRIPEDRYRTRFGPSHLFRVYSQPVVVVEGCPRFQFGGFWFSVLDPWPEYWSDRWYDDDDVYIDYAGDGYYLYNPRHPMDRIAVSVSIRLN